MDVQSSKRPPSTSEDLHPTEYTDRPPQLTTDLGTGPTSSLVVVCEELHLSYSKECYTADPRLSLTCRTGTGTESQCVTVEGTRDEHLLQCSPDGSCVPPLCQDTESIPSRFPKNISPRSLISVSQHRHKSFMLNGVLDSK